MPDDTKSGLLQEKLAKEEAKLMETVTISVGDVFNGRTIMGVRTVDGVTFVSYDGSTWEAA